MNKILKDYILKNLEEAHIDYKYKGNLNEIVLFVKSLSDILKDEDFSNKKLKFQYNKDYINEVSYIIHSVLNRIYDVEEMPLKAQNGYSDREKEGYKKYLKLYPKLLKIFLSKNQLPYEAWPSFLLDTARNHPTIFWLAIEILYKSNPEKLLKSISEVSKLSKEKLELIDYYFSNYRSSYKGKTPQSNMNLSYMQNKIVKTVLNYIGENELYRVNPMSHLMNNFHKDSPFFDLFINSFKITHENIAIAYLSKENIPKNKIQMLIDNIDYNEIIKKKIKFSLNQVFLYDGEIKSNKLIFRSFNKHLFVLSNSLLDTLYEEGYSLEQSLLDYQIKQYKFIQNNIKEQLNLNKKDNRILNPKVASILRRITNYKVFVKNVSGYDTPLALREIGKNFISKKIINQNYLLSVMTLKNVLKNREVSQEQFFRIVNSNNFKEIFNSHYNWSDKNHIKFLQSFSTERIEKLFINSVSVNEEDNKLHILFKDSSNMFFTHPEVKERLFKLKFNKMNNWSKLHNRLVEISAYYETDFKDFRNENTKDLFAKFNNIPLGDYTLVLPKNNIFLKSWSKVLHNCIGNSSHYGDEFQSGENILYGLYKGDVVNFAIEIRNKEIVQFEGKYRKKPSDDLLNQVFDKLVELKLIKE